MHLTFRALLTELLTKAAATKARLIAEPDPAKWTWDVGLLAGLQLAAETLIRHAAAAGVALEEPDWAAAFGPE